MADKLIITYNEYKKVVEKLALEIEKKYKPTVLVGIMRGAAPIIDILSRIFKLPTAYVVIQSYSGDTVQDKQGELIFARDISAIATNEDFKNVLLVDDLSDTGLTLNKSIEWLKEYEPVKDHISEIKTACLWKKKSSTFTPDFCPILLDNDPWIVQPSEYYDEIEINAYQLPIINSELFDIDQIKSEDLSIKFEQTKAKLISTLEFIFGKELIEGYNNSFPLQ